MMFVYFGGDNYYCSGQIMSEGKMYFERKLKNKVVFFLSLVVKSCRCLEVWFSFGIVKIKVVLDGKQTWFTFWEKNFVSPNWNKK